MVYIFSVSSCECQVTLGRISLHSFICSFTFICLSIYSTNIWGEHFYISGTVFPLQLSEWFKNQSVHKAHLATQEHTGSDCQWRCLLNQRFHPASSFTNFKDTGHYAVQEEKREVCHPHAALCGLSCRSGHALATLTGKVSQQCMWFASLTQKSCLRHEVILSYAQGVT